MKNKFPFWIAIILGALTIFGPSIIASIVGIFLDTTGFSGMALATGSYFIFVPFFGINFFGFALGSKKVALSILVITTIVLVSLFVTQL